MGTRLVSVSGLGGRLPAYELPLSRIELMGLELEPFPVLSQARVFAEWAHLRLVPLSQPRWLLARCS
jgi:hypothetical protein